MNRNRCCLRGDRTRIAQLCGRCPMTTVDPDSLAVDRAVLKDIITRFDGKLALNAAVLRPGTIRVGDPVLLVRPTD